MNHRFILPSICHGVLIWGLVLTASLPVRAGGPDPKPKSPGEKTYLETILSKAKGTLDVEWKMSKSPLGKNLYDFEILAPAKRQNAVLIVDGHAAKGIGSYINKFSHDFSNYNKTEVIVSLAVFDADRVGVANKTVEIVDPRPLSAMPTPVGPIRRPTLTPAN
jgi:hypothetical protein